MMKNYEHNQLEPGVLTRSLLILFLLIHLPVGVIHASYTTLGNKFRNFTTQDGLADNMIFCIHKDQKSFMWFGTNYGLSRYDGKSFYNYSIWDDFNISVSKIEETNEDLLYLLSNDWITLFDSKKECVKPLNIRINNKNCQIMDFSLMNDSVLLACDTQFFLKINVLQRTTKPQAQIIGTYKYPLKEEEMFVHFCFSSDKKDFYVVTNFGRVLMIEWSTMNIKEMVQLPITNEKIGISSISYYDQSLWITSMVDGIFICDRFLQHVDHLVNGSTYSSLSHNDVYSVCCLSENSYVAATWFGYTIIHRDTYKKNAWVSEVFQQMSCDVNQNIETRMISSYYDPVGVLWIGTHGGGVIMIDLRWNFYKRFEQGCDNETESIVADNKDNIYLATYHLGIMRSVEPYSEKGQNLDFKPISIPNVSPTFLCSVKDKEGNLWFGNKDGNLVCYDSFRASYRIYDALSHLNVSVHSLFIDAQNHFWVGTSNGLFLLDKQFHIEKHIMLDNEHPKVFDIKEDREHNLWVATGIGVFYLQTKENDWKVTKCVQSQPANTAQCVLVASDGNVYVGFKNGLGIIRNKTMRFSKFLTVADGLISNWINCITEGEEGDIWIGTNSGITRYDQKSKCYNYYISGSNRSVAKIGNVLFFGGSKQELCFNPEKAVFSFESNYKNKVFITNLEVDGKRINIGEKYNKQTILNQQITYTNEIKLNYENRNLALAFSNCSYSYGMQKYEYRLYPYQKEWNICNDGEGVSYANLYAGKYSFQVRAIYPGKYNGEITTLKIKILPHWSQTWIFRIGVVLCVITILLYLFQKIKNQQCRRERMLCLEHDLDTANMLKEQEHNMSKEREQFFVQVAHDLRTPLTLIFAPLGELLLSTDKNSASYTKLQYILKSANSIQYLINQLLQVQKMKAGMLKLSICKTAIQDLVERSAFSFKEFAVQQGFEFNIDIDYNTDIYIDVEKMESVIKNLLSNAFKYTSAGGKISLTVFYNEQDGDGYCCVQVRDTGVGIALEHQSRIFSSFATGDQFPKYSTAVGIGLYIVRSTLELHHGFVKLASKVGEGSSFTLFIPEGKSHFADDNYKILESSENAEVDLLSEQAPTMSSIKNLNEWSLLIVEDNMEVRNYIVSLFSDKYRIYEACNGEEGIQMAGQLLPDLVITDVMMPIKDGFEFSKKLKSDSPTFHIPIIMLTAKAEDVDIIKATQLGIDDYLTKPFNAGVLKAKVENLLLQRQLLKNFYSKSLNLKFSDSAPEVGGEEAFMQKVINIIEANLTNDVFSAKMLAGLLNVSQPTLYRKIKDICQLSIIEVIRNVRISKAASLLLLKKYSVQEVCEMVGYNDYDTFRKHFVAKFKVSPSRYDNSAEHQ